jgi:hypothetical protein
MDEKELEYCRHVSDDIAKHPELRSTPEFLEMDRAGQMQASWQRLRNLYDINRDRYYYNDSSLSPFRWAQYLGTSPVLLSVGVYYNVIDMFGSQEQREKWLEPCKRLHLIGCYAQTELGHGSNVAGLETTATLDRATD